MSNLLTQDSVIIVPSEQIVTTTVTSFKVRVRSLTLFSNVDLSVDLFDASNKLIGVKMVKLSGKDYTDWGSDDTYINTYVATSLGFSIAPDAPPA